MFGNPFPQKQNQARKTLVAVNPSDQHATTFDFTGNETFGCHKDGVHLIRGISCHIRHLSLDELRANDHFALKNGFITDRQRQSLEEIAKANKEEAEHKQTPFIQKEFIILPHNALVTRPNETFDFSTTTNKKDPFSKPAVTSGFKGFFASSDDAAEKPGIFNNNNQVTLGGQKNAGAGGTFYNGPAAPGFGTSSVFANTNATPAGFIAGATTGFSFNNNNNQVPLSSQQAAVASLHATTAGPATLVNNNNQVPLGGQKNAGASGTFSNGPAAPAFGTSSVFANTNAKPAGLPAGATTGFGFINNSNQVPLSSQKSAGAPINATATGPTNLANNNYQVPLGVQNSVGAIGKFSNGPAAPTFGTSSMSANTNVTSAGFPVGATTGFTFNNNNNQVPLSSQKPAGGLFLNSNSQIQDKKETSIQSAAATGASSIFANKDATIEQSTFNKNNNLSHLEAEKPVVGNFSQAKPSLAQPKEKPEVIFQSFGGQKATTNLAAEVETKKQEAGEIAHTQKKEQSKSTGLKSKEFYQELTKRMFTANVMELFEQYEATVPEDLLENTDFMPKLFELFDNFNIEFTKRVVPNVKVTNPADLDVSSDAKEPKIALQGSKGKDMIGKGKEEYEEVKLNEMPQGKSKKICAKPDDDDDEEEDDLITQQQPQKKDGLFMKKDNEGEFGKQKPGFFNS